MAPRSVNEKDETDESDESKSNESHVMCQYVSSRGIAYSCDIYPSKIVSDTTNFPPSTYKNIKDNDIVYVVSSVLNKFVNNILPDIESNNIKIILVTGSSITSVPTELSEKHKIDYIEKIANNSCIKHWFCQNYDLKDSNIHEKVSAIPLGIDYHTVQTGKCLWDWGPQKTALQQEEELMNIAQDATAFDCRSNKTFSFFQFKMFKRHDGDRHLAIKALKKKPFNNTLAKRCPRNETWKNITDYKFIISPHGNGLDCHRTYEALFLGSIPIVRTSPLDVIYKDMPIIILKDWNEINIDKLVEQSKQTILKSKEKFYLKYWTNLIRSKL